MDLPSDLLTLPPDAYADAEAAEYDAAAVEALEALLVPDVALPEFLAVPAWQERAACRGTDLETFFPERERGPDGVVAGRDPKVAIAEARAICGRCDVREACLAWAVEHDEHGVWGGTTRAERQQIKRQAA